MSKIQKKRKTRQIVRCVVICVGQKINRVVLVFVVMVDALLL